MTTLLKKKKVSKKKKSSWRKHVNIQDVEDYLEDRRLEERLGVFSVKKDEELFVIDTQPNIGITESKKQRKRLELANKGPRCYEILTPHTKVPDPKGRRTNNKQIGSLPADLSNLSTNRKREKGIFKRRSEIADKNRKMAKQNRFQKRKALSDFERNLWNDDVEESENKDLSFEWVSKEAKLNTMIIMGGKRRGPARAPSATLVTSKLPAVIPPHPGSSYNPSYQDHQELLRDIAEKETKVIKQEEHLNRVTTKMFQKVDAKQRNVEWLKEMSAEIPTIDLNADRANVKSEDDSDTEYRAINPPTQNKKKSARQRRKLKEHRAEQDRIRRVKQEKKKMVEVYRLRKIEAEIDKTEAKLDKAKVIRDKKRADYEATGLKKLNAHKLDEPGEEFLMASELTGNLRSLNSGGNLLRERYVSMQRRNILPPSRIFSWKQTKGKKYIKRSHKIPEDKLKSMQIKK